MSGGWLKTIMLSGRFTTQTRSMAFKKNDNIKTKYGIIYLMKKYDEILLEVWQWDQKNGGEFAHINRPIAGATHQQTLPRGKQNFQLYTLPTPNGVKVKIMLEELILMGKTAEYDAWRIDIRKGQQFGSDFVAINPNSKIPALLDFSDTKPIRVFESGAILLYLAEKFSALLPTSPSAKAECLSWLFWQMGSAPFLGGGFGHFYAYAPQKWAYPINRFAMEVKRQLDVLDKHLANNRYLCGEQYTIADIATYPWYGALAEGRLYQAGVFLSVSDYSHLLRWCKDIATRPAVQCEDKTQDWPTSTP